MLKSLKRCPFYILRHYETVQNSLFSSDIRLSQYISIFFNTIQTILRFTKEETEFLFPERYIRTFDVISEVICILPRRSCRIKKVLVFVSARYIRTSEAFSEHEPHPLGVSIFCEVFTNVLDIFSKRFLSLTYALTLDVPVLLINTML